MVVKMNTVPHGQLESYIRAGRCDARTCESIFVSTTVPHAAHTTAVAIQVAGWHLRFAIFPMILFGATLTTGHRVKTVDSRQPQTRVKNGGSLNVVNGGISFVWVRLWFFMEVESTVRMMNTAVRDFITEHVYGSSSCASGMVEVRASAQSTGGGGQSARVWQDGWTS